MDRTRLLRVAAPLAMLLFSSCVDHTDFSGTYVGEGKVTYRTKDGVSKELTVPNDSVIVKMTDRHYQYSAIEVTVDGCTLHSGTGGGETAWSLSSERGHSGACTFDVPTVGRVLVRASGGLDRYPAKQSVKAKEVRLSFYGDGPGGEFVGYTIQAKPK